MERTLHSCTRQIRRQDELFSDEFRINSKSHKTSLQISFFKMSSPIQINEISSTTSEELKVVSEEREKNESTTLE